MDSSENLMISLEEPGCELATPTKMAKTQALLSPSVTPAFSNVTRQRLIGDPSPTETRFKRVIVRQ